jgi:hypothetical protein
MFQEGDLNSWEVNSQGEPRVGDDVYGERRGPWSAICLTEANSLGARPVSAEEAEANARLIAAAPEMLSLVQDLSQYGGNMPYIEWCHMLRRLALDLLTKHELHEEDNDEDS